MHEPPSVLLKFVFLGIFQKLLGGLFVAVRCNIHFWAVFGFLTGTAWQHVADHQTMQARNPFSGFFWWSAWRCWTPAKRREPVHLILTFLCVLEWFWLRKWEVLIGPECLGVMHNWNTCEWRSNWTKIELILFRVEIVVVTLS